MAVELPLFNYSFLAYTASLATAQFKAVKLDTNGIVLCTAVTDHPIGILQDKPAQGAVGNVAMAGISKYVAQGNITRGDMLGLGTTDGAFVTIVLGTDTTLQVLGQALDTVADGDIGTGAFSFLGQARAA